MSAVIGLPILDLLVVSQACCIQINRHVYKRLSEMGWSVEIVTDRMVPDTTIASDPAASWEKGLHCLERGGARTRYYYYRGLQALLNRAKPRAVLLDLEPDSLLAWQIGRWCHSNNSQFLIQSCENLPILFWKAVGAGKLKQAVRSAIMRGINLMTRSLIGHVFAISSGVMEQMHRLGYADRCSLIPLGFDASIFVGSPQLREQKRRQLGLTQPVVAYFGRLVPTKGVHILIEALSKIRTSQWQFLIDDFSETRSEYCARLIELIDELGLKDRVVFFRATHGEMPAFMNAADVVVLPSITTDSSKEQYGRVVPEAMACGRAVIVSDCGALPELVGATGLIVPENDVDALASAIDCLIKDEARRNALGALARQRALQFLTTEVQAEEISQVLGKLLTV